MTDINLLLLDDFIAEAGEHLDEMESCLLRLAGDAGNLDILNDIFRTVHNIKGGSQLIGLAKVSSLAHRLEDLLDLLRQGHKVSDADIVETLIAGRDRIVQLVGELETSQRELSSVDDLIERLTDLIEGTEAVLQQEAGAPRIAQTAADAVADCDEQNDRELFEIYIENLEEKLRFLATQAARLPDAPDPVEVLERCGNAVERLYRSAKYMDYEELNRLYQAWSARIEETRHTVSGGESASFAFMDDYLDRLVGIFPQLGEARGAAAMPAAAPTDSNKAAVDDDADITAAVLEAFGEDEEIAEKETCEEETCATTDINLSLLDDFIAEAGEHLDEMESCLLRLAGDAGNLDILNDIFRTVHNIKGGSQFAGLAKVSSLAHRLEDLLDLLRQGHKVSDADIVETLIAGRDRIVQLVGELETSQRELSTVDDLVERLTGLIEGTEAVSQQEAAALCIAQAAADAAADWEEQHDRELFGIFIQSLEEELRFLAMQAARLPDAPDPVEVLERCGNAVERLRRSANYMDYEELTGLYEAWGTGIEETRRRVSGGESASFAFMDDYLDRLVGIFPQLGEARAAGARASAECSESGQAAENVTRAMVGEEPRTGKSASTETGDDKALFDRLSRTLETSLQNVSDSEYEALQDVFEEIVSPRKEGKGADTAVTARATKTTGSRARPQQKKKAPVAVERQESKIRKSMRVDVEKIDSLMNQVGELVVDRSYFFQLFSEMRDLQKHLKETTGISQKDVKMVRAFSYKLGEAIASLGRTSNELQEGVMKMRMLPVSHLFNRYPRLVHDLTHNLDKKVNLVIRGEETELDKMIVEELSDPLIHIIRNAIDHGLESADARKQLGKADTGTLILQAYQESNHIVIEITDDGRGIDLNGIKATALKKQLHTEDELERMTGRELTHLILAPGFSTAKEVTGTSGRGVGMDVVKRNIEKLNGTLEIDSKPGAGTRIRMKIPLTLAIIHALMVRVGADLFTIPLTNVDETIRISASDTSIVEGVEVVHVRGVALPIFRLSTLFGLDSGNGAGKSFVVVVSTDGKRVGFVVDELHGQEEVVIKPLADYVQEKSGFSGATVVGDGRIALILDVHELVKMTADRQGNRQKERTAALKSNLSHSPRSEQALAGQLH